jgi:Icc protein
MIRFVHISDTHVVGTADGELWGYRPSLMLEVLVGHIKALPFTPDFVLHTGDVTQDASDEAYQTVFSALNKLSLPLFLLPGNHDNPAALSQAWTGNLLGTDRLDYTRDFDGIRLLAYDTRAEIRPGERLPSGVAGMMTEQQLAHLRQQCADSARLIIAIHHQPVKLDSNWLDDGFDDDGKWENMVLGCAEEFLDSITPARDRICGVFFGHVHRAFQVVRDGILFSSAPSALLQFQSFPGHTRPVRAGDELPGFNIVTVTDEQTIVRQYTFPRPAM